jgi:uncharacterized membrane protein
MAQQSTLQHLHPAPPEIAIRKLALADLWIALKSGYDDFNARPSFGVFVVIIYPTFALLLTMVARGDGLLHLLFPMVAGFTLLGPVVSVALFEMSRRRENGLDLAWRSTFGFIHTASFAPILALSVFMMMLYVAWLFMAQFLYLGLFGADPPGSLAELWGRLWTTRQGAALLIYGGALGMIFAFTALAVSVVSFPLLLDRPTTTLRAIGTSIRAVTSNLFVMLVWGLTVATLLAAGAVVFLIGLAVVLPVLGHATWHLYRRVVEV